MSNEVSMSSSRPYMLRAIYQWIVDNDCTPYLLVDASHEGVQVPPQAVKDGKVVLNMAPQAIASLDMGNQDIVFLTRFSGVSMQVRVPVEAARALYAQETGQGMMFQDEAVIPGGQAPKSASKPASELEGPVKPVESGQADDNQAAKPKKGAPHLRVIK